MMNTSVSNSTAAVGALAFCLVPSLLANQSEGGSAIVASIVTLNGETPSMIPLTLAMPGIGAIVALAPAVGVLHFKRNEEADRKAVRLLVADAHTGDGPALREVHARIQGKAPAVSLEQLALAIRRGDAEEAFCPPGGETGTFDEFKSWIQSSTLS